MDLNTQTKVLRVIQEGEFERVGGTKTVKVDVRIVAATHRNLESMIAEGAFREDLYYRLCVVPIRVPGLVQRPEDIPLLAVHFIRAYCRENGMREMSFTPEALNFLTRQEYPGNIRQLKNIVERAAIMSPSVKIDVDFLRSILDTRPRQPELDLFTLPRPLNQAKEELEKTYVQTQLRLNKWDISATARILGIERTNLHRKIRQLGIEKETTHDEKPRSLGSERS